MVRLEGARVPGVGGRCRCRLVEAAMLVGRTTAEPESTEGSGCGSGCEVELWSWMVMVVNVAVGRRNSRRLSWRNLLPRLVRRRRLCHPLSASSG